MPLKDAPKRKRQPGEPKLPKAIAQPIAMKAGRTEFVQRDPLPTSAFGGPSAMAAFFAPRHKRYDAAMWLDDDTHDLVDPNAYTLASNYVAPPSPNRARHRVRRAAQHATWRDNVVPTLIPTYLRYVHGKAGLQDLVPCSCSRQRRLVVILADWDGECARAVCSSYLQYANVILQRRANTRSSYAHVGRRQCSLWRWGTSPALPYDRAPRSTCACSNSSRSTRSMSPQTLRHGRQPSKPSGRDGVL